MFEKIEKFVSCACVSIMAVLVFSNVIARFLFKHSLAVSDEMSTYLFVLMSFMGTAIAARRRAHLGLSIITDHVSPHTRLIIQLVMYGISVLFCLLIVVFRCTDGHQPVSAGSGNCQYAVARVDLWGLRPHRRSLCGNCFFQTMLVMCKEYKEQEGEK